LIWIFSLLGSLHLPKYENIPYLPYKTNTMGLSNFSWVWVWVFVFAMLFVRYILFAVVGYVIFYVIGKKKLAHRKIQATMPNRTTIGREIRTSLPILAIFGTLAILIIYLIRNGYSQFYFDFSNRGYPYFIGSIFLLMVLHDTWFYWIHRLMHLPSMYKWLHRTHHLSVNPTPFTSFSMDCKEALIEFGVFPILILIVPLHPNAFLLFTLVAFLFNIMGHLGYEIFPRWFFTSWIGKWINTSTHHNLHHSGLHYNYGYYFTFWDKLLKTEKIQ